MKVFTSLTLLLILAGCSPDGIAPAQQELSASGLSHKNAIALPANPSNPEDFIGTLYAELLQEYELLNTKPATLPLLIQQGETLAWANADFLAMEDLSAYDPISVADVQAYQNIDAADLRSHLSAGYSTVAKDLYVALAAELTAVKANDGTYQEACEAIMETEGLIIAAPNLMATERNAMLMAASIMRNAVYDDGRKRKRDRDWEWMTGHYAATANGALESSPQALLLSFVTDLYND
ncbi:hypothetical protein [Flavobacterium sp. C4GT6]|uniref:hypothetical protein n=1 Tax=Flavobacterium sp. C4GT6 TaxID=3103818 RepID=UPI002ED619CE